ncbi:hypothetical protein FKM82_003211 [Ascaphus truei]
MDNSIYNLLEKIPMVTDAQSLAQLPFCVDPAVKFHLYPEASRFSYSEDLALLSFAADQPVLEHYYNDPYNIPFQPTCLKFGHHEGSYGPSYIRKRNERERQRVKCVNEGYAKLRRQLPPEYLGRRLSKVQTLRAAIKYIKHLQDVLCWDASEASIDILQGRSKEPSSNISQIRFA